MKQAILDAANRIVSALRRADARLSRRLPLTALAFGALLALATAAFDLTVGPLYNLNDIGVWRYRLLFNVMAAFVHLSLMCMTALLCRRGTARAMLRQLLVTVGFLILMLGINQKTYVYVRTVQPIVRAMDTGALAAAAGAETNLTAPALTLLYLISRGPVYDMYLVKLFADACCLTLALLAARAAEEWGEGMRPEAALALCVILPEGFLSAGCAAEFETAAALLLALSLALALGRFGVKKRPLAAALCYGGAAALSGVALYALPLYALLIARGEMRLTDLARGAALAALLCMPAAVCGMGVGTALGSLTRASWGVPCFASGAPGLPALFPRAAVEEMPGYFVLGRLPELDMETGAQPYYTQAHMEIAVRSVTLLGLALLLAVWVAALRRRGDSPLRRMLALCMGALLVCPRATSSAWLAPCMLCALALVLEPGLRLPACLTLFATTCACAHPVTGETLLPPVVALALCGVALALLLGALELPALGRDADG